MSDAILAYRDELRARLTPHLASAIARYVRPATAVEDAGGRRAVELGLVLPWDPEPPTWRVHHLLPEDVARQARPLLD